MITVQEKLFTKHQQKVSIMSNWFSITKNNFSDSCFEIWAGCYSSPTDQLAVMACPARNGFHSLATYTWEKDDQLLPGQETPLIYSGVGRYKCTIKAKENALSVEFIVYGVSIPTYDIMIA